MILHITVNIDRKGKLRNKLLADKIFIFQFVYYFFPIVFHYSLNIFSEIQFYVLSLYISYLQMFSFGLNTHEISRF